MDEEFSISQLAERDAPALMMTEKMVTCLRACMLFATSRRASRVQLIGSGAGFASELTLIANQGLDALTDAFKFLNDMSLTADSLAKEGGTLERLQSTIGVPAERKSHDRLLKRLEEELGTCYSGGADLEKKLTSWRTEVERFRGIVSKTNERYIKKSEERDNDIARYGGEIEMLTPSLQEAEKNRTDAEVKYNESQKYKRSLIDHIVASEEFNTKEVLGMTSTMIKLGWNWYSSGVIAQSVEETREEVDRWRELARNKRTEIEEAEVVLQKLSGESKSLDEFSKILTPVLGNLVFLTDNLRSLMLGFSTMEPLLKRILSRKSETVSISQDARDGPASLADVRDFKENAKEMSAWALKINHIAGLYASIIESVLIGGLNNVRNTAAGDGDEFGDTLDFSHAAQRQQLYLQGNSSSCDTIRSQVDARYEKEKLSMETRHEADRERFSKVEKEAKKQARKQEKKGSGRLNFFSRT